MTARAAKGTFPYPHRTVAQIWATVSVSDQIAELEAIGRRRALAEHESQRLERLIRKAAA